MDVKVSNMEGINGRKIPNQFEITTNDGIYFQSYNTIIAVKRNGQIFLDKDSWDYSRTTGKYRNIFLGKSKKETKQAIKNGIIQLVDLNK